MVKASVSVFIFLVYNHFYFDQPRVAVADPHHLVADPDPARHFDANPDLYPPFHFDPDPDPDPSFLIKAQTL